MKKTRVAFPVCALMALALCATPTGALANESSDLAFAEEEVAFVDQKAEPAKAQAAPGKAQDAVADQSLELEEEQSLETIPQDVQVSAGEELEREDENAMQEEGDAEVGGQGSDQGSDQNDVEKTIVSCKLMGEVKTHHVGEDLDLTGLYWLVTYDDGSTSREGMNPRVLDGYDLQREGMYSVYCEQKIGDWTWFGHFCVSVFPSMRAHLVGYGQVADINVKPSTRPVAAKRIDPGFSANVDFSTAPQILKKLEYQYSFNKGRAIKPTTDQLFVAGARMFDTAFVAKKKNGSPTGNNGNSLVERISEGGKLYAHCIKIGVGYRF